jgi:arylsulfatase A-like enzyme
MQTSNSPVLAKAKNFMITAAKLPVSSDTLTMVAAIIVPAIIGLIGIKTYKIIFALWPVTRSTSFWEEPSLFGAIRIVLVSPLSFLLIAFLLSYVSLWQRFINRRWLGITLMVVIPLIFLPLAKTIWSSLKKESLTSAKASWWHQVVHVYWDALGNIQFLSGMYSADIYFLLGYAIIATLVLGFIPSRWRRPVYALFIGFNAIILTIAGLELAHYLKTGMNATVSMLVYFLKNARDLIAMVGDEFNTKTMLAMAVPPLLILLSPAIVRLEVKEVWLHWQNDKSVVRIGKIVWPVLLFALLVPGRFHPDYARLKGNLVLTLGRDVVFQHAEPAAALDEGLALRQASEKLNFVPTDHAKRLNIVIVMMESVRATSTGIYDPALKNTPFLTELSKKSLIADEMYAVIPRTSSAWVSVLQGTYPGTNSALMFWANQEAKNPRFASLPRLLQKNGYQTGFFVPTHLGYENEGQLLSNMGFDKIMSEKDYGQTDYEHVGLWGLEDRVMLKPIASWIDAQRTNHKPFLLTIMTNVGHEMYFTPTTWKHQKFTEEINYNNYLNCIAYVDDFLQQLFAEFKARGLYEDTVFFIFGDHGDSFWEHGTKERALSLYEEAVHIPLVVFAPSLFPEGGKITGVRQQIDILPSVADVLGYSITGGTTPGVSLFKDDPQERVLYYGSYLEEVAAAMRKGSRKYIYKFDSSPMEVYDLAKDPEEKQDLAGELGNEEIRSVENQILQWNGAVRTLMMGSER